MNSKPFFSVVIPTYNLADFIFKTIQSVLNQTYPAFEIIIIDDGSRDNTEAVVKAIPDKRIVYQKVENGERGRARNIGTLQAKGDYITFIDSDDLAYPNHLAEAARMVASYKEPEM
ncbi:MAG: glycosyl transferase, partial [Cytophagales bacterium CG18_big_fil_WC_8_21_14_2_50_42_9]